jgi:hypothetical protein
MNVPLNEVFTMLSGVVKFPITKECNTNTKKHHRYLGLLKPEEINETLVMNQDLDPKVIDVDMIKSWITTYGQRHFQNQYHCRTLNEEENKLVSDT